MPRLPKKKSETQFELQVDEAIKMAFPWLPTDSVTHQDSFSFRFGHSTVTVNAKPRSSAKARSDILLSHKGKPLAILELKKPDVSLTEEDEEQGLSYARVLHPRPPLVVITNSKKIKILTTDDGQEWNPSGPKAEALAVVIERTMKVAENDLQHAIATLMGDDPEVWVQALNEATRLELENRTGELQDAFMPFARDFLISRRVTQDIRQRVQERDARLITVEGSPLSGKSNVLRELCLLSHPGTTGPAYLYIDADADLNVCGRVADILANALDWRITADDAREWLKKLARGDGPPIVLAIDNLRPDRPDIRREIESLTSGVFGDNLKLVVAMDDGVAVQLTEVSNRRQISIIGKRATRFRVDPLSYEEFSLACRKLKSRRLFVTYGARHSAELRTLWILRSVVAHAVSLPKYKDETVVAALSPVPGLELLLFAQQRFDVTRSPFNLYRELARALLIDASDHELSYQLRLESMEAFIVRRSTALDVMPKADLDVLLAQGLIREARSQSGENVFVVRLPELMALELGDVLASELNDHAERDPREAGQWLVSICGSFPLGDIVAADAIIKMAEANNGVDYGVMSVLRSMEPTKGTFSPGSKVATRIEGVGVLDIDVSEQGKMIVRLPDNRVTVDQSDLITWDSVWAFSILAHLAAYPFEQMRHAEADGAPERKDGELLLAVGSVPFILRRAGGNVEVNSIPIHDIGAGEAIVCHAAGIVETVTWSMVRYFMREGQVMRDAIVDAAVDRGNLPLLARLEIALRYLIGSSGEALGQWAAAALNGRISPAMDKIMPGLRHD
jgi:hypothetical protein